MEALGWTDNCEGSGEVAGVQTSDGMNNPETISRTWAYTDACGNAVSHTQAITLIAAPVVDAGEDTLICQGALLSLAATVAGGVDSTFWSSSGDGNFDDPSLPGAAYSPGLADQASGQALLIFTAIPLAPGCSVVTDTIVADFEAPPPADAGPDQEITCDDPTVVLGAMGGSGLLYEWSGPGIDDSNRNNPMPEVGSPGVYILEVSPAGSALSCQASDTVVVSTDTGFPVGCGKWGPCSQLQSIFCGVG